MPAQIVDLFCGIGGLTRGLINVGLDVCAGFDVDDTCRYAYEINNQVKFQHKNIRNLTGNEVLKCYQEGATHILVGCAPCQPFSQMRSKLGNANYNDDKYDLLREFGRLIEVIQPSVVSMENVPQLQHSDVFKDFLEILRKNEYYVEYQVANCADYGIPQKRRRLILVASQLGPIKIIAPTYNRSNVTIDSYIRDLPPITAGEICQFDPMHRASNLSETNLKRIRASAPGGTWRDWPIELRSPCHCKESGETFSSVYSRMSWNRVGPTITTQFYSYGTGRHGHPDQDRALSLREGALLQTFPQDYHFIDPDQPFSFKGIARHIGNAVPVKLGEVIGCSILQHLQDYNIEG